MQTQRWLIEYDVSASISYFTETAAIHGVRIAGVYPHAHALVAEAGEKTLLDWVATLALRGVRSNPFPGEEVESERDEQRRQLMIYWNEYLAASAHNTRSHEGLSWDHPGFLPPDRPGDPSSK